MKATLVFLLFAIGLNAQMIFGGSSAARAIGPRGDTLPPTCSPPQVFLRTGATAPGVYGCTATDTWVGPSGVGASGDVEGPASSVDGEAAVFDGITGKLIKRFAGSGVGIFSSGVLSTDSGLQFNTGTKSLGVFGPIVSGQTSNYLGQFVLNGITSGAVTIQPANAAGTWTLTLPTTDGDNGQVLTTNGSGVASWTTPSSGGMTNPMTTAQDIIVGGTSGDPARLGVGGEGTVLKVVSGAVAWGTDSTGGSPAFSDVAAGTNTTAAMVVGTGASLAATGSGTIAATSAAALAAQYIDWNAASGGSSIANKPNVATAASGGSLTTSGAHAITLTATGATNVTLPTSGTLLAVSGTDEGSIDLSEAAGNGSNYWRIKAPASLGADRTLVLPDATGTAGQVLAVGTPSGATLPLEWASNVPTATALAANGANCSAGQAPLGVDASGAAEGCFAVATVASGGTLTTSGAHGITLTATGTTNVTLPTTGTLATTAQVLVSALNVSGTATLGTSSISSGACATAVTVSATGVATTDVITFTPNADITAVTGYAPVTTGGLAIYPYPTADNVNFKVCNPTASAITPGAVTLNWRVVR